MDQSAGDKCLERLGTSMNALLRDPGLFLTRLHPSDRSRYMTKLRDVTPEADVQVVLHDENNRPRRDKISIGMFVEFVEEGTNAYKVGLVVACLLSRLLVGNQPQDLLLVVELPAENGETAKMPAADSLCRVVPTSAITCKIDVEQRPNSAPAKLLSDDAGFVVAVNSSFYGIDQDGTHAIGSYVVNLVSVARSRRGEMFATTENCRLLSVELDKGRVKELAITRLADSVRRSHHEAEFAATPVIQVRGLCFAEGKPAAFDSKVQPGACQMYGIAKDVPNRGGDCIVTVSPSGRLDVVFELGRRDAMALAIVPLRLSASEPVNVWSRVGPGDSDSKAMRFIIWTERGGLFVVDETRRCLQQLGGDLVRSLEISAVAFDYMGDLYAAGSNAMYSVSPTGRVVEVATLAHLPGRVNGICAAPRQVAHPGLFGDEFADDEDTSKEQKSPTKPRSRSWWSLSRSSNSGVPQIGDDSSKQSLASSGVTNLLRLLRIKSKASETPAKPPKQLDLEPQPIRQQRQPPQMVGGSGSFSGRRVSNPLLPMEGTSLGEANKKAPRDIPATGKYDDDSVVYGEPRSRLNESYHSANSSSSPSKFRYANEAPPPSRGPYFPTEADEEDQYLAQTVRPPPMSQSVMASTARKGPVGDFPPPPSSVPPPTTARASTSPVKTPAPVAGAGQTRYPDVPSMLLSLGLGQYVQDFRNEDLLDINLLCSMYQNERDFKEMLKSLGVAKLGHREMIAHAVKQHTEG